MKIVLSIDPVKFPLTGIGRYTYELAKGLQSSNLEHLVFMRGTRLQTTLPTPGQSAAMARLPAWKSWVQKSRLAVGAYRVLNPLARRRALKGLEDHVYHGPNFYLPPFAGKSVVTIHDLSPYLWPQSHPAERVRYMQAEIALSLKRASALITDTEYTRQEVARFFNWPLTQVHAVPLASASEFKPRSPEELVSALAPLGLTPLGYTLFTGTIEPRKNLDVLLKAYARLPAPLRRQWPLVVAGYRGWASDALHARMQAAQSEGWLHYLGYVSGEMLPLLMAGARLFSFPSHYEGFGLPVLEAMACGVPVICANASTLPEVAGNAAAFHATEDVEGLTELLRNGLENAPWREQASQAGIEQAARFSWRRCVEETRRVYETVAAA